MMVKYTCFQCGSKVDRVRCGNEFYYYWCSHCEENVIPRKQVITDEEMLDALKWFVKQLRNLSENEEDLAMRRWPWLKELT